MPATPFPYPGQVGWGKQLHQAITERDEIIRQMADGRITPAQLDEALADYPTRESLPAYLGSEPVVVDAARQAARQAITDEGGIADPVIAAAITTPGSQTGQIVTRKAKDVDGGQFLAPVRVPTLVITDRHPNHLTAHLDIVWADESSGEVYAMAFDAYLYKSDDGGRTWRRLPGRTANIANGVFLKTQAGTLLLASGNRPPHIQRSTDDSETWTTRMTMRADTVSMGPQSWTQNPVTGFIYLGEYQTPNSGFTEIRVSYSTDDGETWSTLHAFPGPATSDPHRIRHIHSIVSDPIGGRTYILAGDSEQASGIYRISEDGHSVEPWLTNADVTGHTDGARSIGMMFFPDYIAWGVDGSAAAIMRVPRAHADNPAGHHEYIYKLNATAWWTTRASNDNTRWLISASNEPGSAQIDDSAHLYAVEDGGATVYELAAMPSDATSFASIAPVGQAEMHGDTFWLRGHGFPNRWAVRGRLAYGTTGITPPSRDAPVITTRSSGRVALSPEQPTARFARIRVTVQCPVLYIWDWGVTGYTGKTLFVRIWDESAEASAGVSTLYHSERFQAQYSDAPYLHRIEFPPTPSRWITAEITQSGTNVETEGEAFISYWQART